MAAREPAGRDRDAAAQEPDGLAARRPGARARLGGAAAPVCRAPSLPGARRRVRGAGFAGLATEWRARAERAAPRRGAPIAGSSGQRIVLSSFGFADSGGGTIVPRYVAKELAQRGHEVTVFAAGVATLEGEPPYAIRSDHRRRRRGRGGAQPAARPARPRASPSRARRSGDPQGLRRAARSRRSARRAPAQPAQPGRSRWSTRRSRGASARSSRPTTTGSAAHATTSSATTSRCATDRGTAGRSCAACVGSRDAAGYARAPQRAARALLVAHRPHPRRLRGHAPHAARPGLPVPDDRRRAPGDARGWRDLGCRRPRSQARQGR